MYTPLKNIGILSFNWLFQDLHLVDMEDFKYGGTNITSFRLVDPHNPEVQNVVKSWMLGEKRFPTKNFPISPLIKVKYDSKVSIINTELDIKTSS